MKVMPARTVLTELDIERDSNSQLLVVIKTDYVGMISRCDSNYYMIMVPIS